MNVSQMKYYKQQLGYSFAKLAELSGVPQGTIQKIFNGETKSPRYDTLRALEAVLSPKEDSAVAEAASFYGKQAATLEDYYALAEEKRAELIDGVFYDMSSPSLSHQIAAVEMGYRIRRFIEEQNGACMLFLAPMDVQLDQDERTMVQPDLFVVCERKKMTERCILGAPDFVIEILSAASRKKDAILKLMKYREAGVREYWMVDLEKERVIVYDFEEDELPRIYGGNEEIPVSIWQGGLKINMKDIFGRCRQS